MGIRRECGVGGKTMVGRPYGSRIHTDPLWVLVGGFPWQKRPRYTHTPLHVKR